MTYGMTGNRRVRRGFFFMFWLAGVAGAAGCGGPPGDGTEATGDQEIGAFIHEATTVAAWKVGTRYRIGALVRFEGVVYECRLAHRAQSSWQPPRTPALWQRPTPAGLAPWTIQTHYRVNSQVTFGGQSWICRQEHVSQSDWTPSKTPSLWALVNRPPPNRPPVVTILSVADGSQHLPDTSISLRAAVTDPDNPAPFTGQVVWSSDVDGPLCEGLTCQSPALRLGPHVLTVRATDSDGATAVASVTIVVNTPPTVAIELPPEGAAFLVGQAIRFRGSARDPEQEIPAAALAWSSHLNGALGTGHELSSAALSPGTHRITLTVTDDLGGTGSTSVSVLVAPLIGPPAALIHEPPHGIRVIAGTSVHLVGLGFDPEDGLSPESALSWSSDLDGPLGTGSTLDVVLSGPPCSAEDRQHRITLTVTDSDGNSASFFVVVRVGTSC